MKLVDLHIHSTFSDGTMTPTQLVDWAARAGLDVMALTDHDTVAGVAEAVSQGGQRGLRVIPGIEVSAMLGTTSMHILGYGLRPDAPGLQESLEKIQVARRERNLRIMEKLAGMGHALSFAELQEIAGPGECGRPHIARLLVQKGIVPSQDLAFRHFLRKGAPAYADRYRFEAADAISMIVNAGGRAVLAHPGKLDPSLEIIPGLLKKMMPMGLAGMEVFYPGHTPKITRKLRRLATEYGLFVTGGSDFHGDPEAEQSLAVEAKKVYLPNYLIDIMRKTAEEFPGEL